VENLKSFRYSDQKRRNAGGKARVKLSYARVLVVDDNLTNLDVIKGMLKPYGMKVDCLSSGQDAITAIQEEKARYDAIFMDHMMPGMDGMEATRHIREIGTDYAASVPIIACTANAIAGNEALFLSRGFQAFLSKPIELKRLDEIVVRFLRDKEKEELWAEQDIRAEEERSSGFDRREMGELFQTLDMDNGLKRFGDDKEAYLDILRSYSINTKPLLEAARVVSLDTLADYAITVHGIKGSSRGILAESVGAKAEALEHAAKAGNFDFVRVNNPEFIEEAGKLIADLENMLGKVSAENPKPHKDKPDPAALKRLLTACSDYDMDEVDVAMAEIEGYVYESDQELVLWLREKVEQMNFPQIIEKLSFLDELV
jgi:CheY-like chemotaxis protein